MINNFHDNLKNKFIKNIYLQNKLYSFNSIKLLYKKINYIKLINSTKYNKIYNYMIPTNRNTNFIHRLMKFDNFSRFHKL